MPQAESVLTTPAPAFDPFALGGREPEALSEKERSNRFAALIDALPERELAIVEGFAEALTKPLSALLARRMEIVAHINSAELEPETEECKAASSELNALEARLFNTTSVGLPDLITQLRFLKTFIDEGFDFDEHCDQLLARVITCAVALEAHPTI